MHKNSYFQPKRRAAPKYFTADAITQGRKQGDGGFNNIKAIKREGKSSLDVI